MDGPAADRTDRTRCQRDRTAAFTGSDFWVIDDIDNGFIPCDFSTGHLHFRTRSIDCAAAYGCIVRNGPTIDNDLILLFRIQR